MNYESGIPKLEENKTPGSILSKKQTRQFEDVHELQDELLLRLKHSTAEKFKQIIGSHQILDQQQTPKGSHNQPQEQTPSNQQVDVITQSDYSQRE